MKLFDTRTYTSRWVIFLIDVLICAFSIIIAHIVRFNLQFNQEIAGEILQAIPLILTLRAVSFLTFKTYAGTVRYTSIEDTERVFVVTFIGSLGLVLVNLTGYFFMSGGYLIPFSIIIMDYLLTSFMMIMFRLFIKSVYFEMLHPSKKRSNALILGANKFGQVTKNVFESNPESKNKVVGFIDLNKNHAGMRLEGVTVYPVHKLDKVLRKRKVSDLIISMNGDHIKMKNEIIEKCLEKGVQILKIPERNQWINGEFSYHQIKNVRIEELMGRETIKLDKKAIIKDLHKKVILVTGAAGSIGSEIVRQLTSFYPKKIILYDQAETPLYELELELKERFGFDNFCTEIGSINSFFRLDQVFRSHKPSIIYHAAAYKHVPLMEEHPAEAVSTNVWGTKNLADLAITHHVDKFVMISTDKAVNPTSVMGATKRIAEMYIQSMNQINSTAFITTRFGNVLGSNGSVIPRFEKQIEKGGPLTITHPQITRYFMSIPEACQLVLEAGTMGKGGEIYIFNMGRSVKILDLAKKMIKLYGLTLGKDIDIQITGLRPGEKLFEELLSDKENIIPTHHPKILIARVEKYNPDEMRKKVQKLIDRVVVTHSKEEIIMTIKKIVPEYNTTPKYNHKNIQPARITTGKSQAHPQKPIKSS